jgi:hypothetical protein
VWIHFYNYFAGCDLREHRKAKTSALDMGILIRRSKYECHYSMPTTLPEPTALQPNNQFAAIGRSLPKGAAFVLARQSASIPSIR